MAVGRLLEGGSFPSPTPYNIELKGTYLLGREHDATRMGGLSSSSIMDGNAGTAALANYGVGPDEKGTSNANRTTVSAT